MSDERVSMTWPQYLRKECKFKDKIIKLTKKETEILSVLLLSHPKPVTTEELIIALYFENDNEPDYSSNCISQFIKRIKRKLGSDVIKQRWYIGYQLNYED